MNKLTTILATTIALGIGATAIGGCSGSGSPKAKTPPPKEKFSLSYARAENIGGAPYYLQADSAGNIQYVRDDASGMGSSAIAWGAPGVNPGQVSRNPRYVWEMPSYLADAAKAVMKAN